MKEEVSENVCSKKIRCILLILLLSGFSSLFASENLVLNGSFEEGIGSPGHWRFRVDSGNPVMKWEEEKERGKVISIFTPDKKSWGRLFSDPTPVIPKRSYLLSIWYKCKIKGWNYKPNIAILFGNNQGKDFRLLTPVSWEKWETVITIPAGVHNIVISPYLYHRPNQTVWFDDVRLTLLPVLKMKEGKLLFQDNRFVKWLVTYGPENYYKVVEAENAEGKKNNVLEANCPTDSTIEADLDEPVKDVKLSMKIKFLNLQINKEKNWAAFVSSLFADKRNDWRFIIFSYSDTLEIKKRREGIESIIGYCTYQFQEGNWYQINIEKYGHHIKWFINDKLVMDEYDSSLLTKKVRKIKFGFVNTHLYLYDIKIVKLIREEK